MELPSDPLKAIFPILAKRKIEKLRFTFLGTGFFIDNTGSFLTAKHIFKNYAVSDIEDYYAVMLSEDVSTPYKSSHKITDLKYSEKFDIALGRVEGVHDIWPLEISTKNAPHNFDILTVEFSGTRSGLIESGERAIIFTPYYRKGHVICYYESTCPEEIPTQSLDLSFPALQGASGAPVVVEQEGIVIGMIVANVERHLLPAQVVKIEDGPTSSEETRYFLPTGKAISWVHLAEFLKECA